MGTNTASSLRRPTMSEDLEPQFRAHRPLLWSLAYRLTGCAADADDVVQETFVRALEHPPRDLTRPWRPWLTRVALNLGRDVLRKRKRRPYVGPWLPSPVATGAGDDPPAFDPPDLAPGPGARYELLESVSVAFLLALEALTPNQRAVLLVRDVLDYSARETAETLGLSEGAVRIAHLRARRAMASYDRERRRIDRASQAEHAAALQRVLICLGTGDATGLAALLAEDVKAVSDGGGEFVAALREIHGRDKVQRFLLGVTAKRSRLPQLELALLCGLPAAVISVTGPPLRGWASRLVFQVALNAEGRVQSIWSTQASRKLTAVQR